MLSNQVLYVGEIINNEFVLWDEPNKKLVEKINNIWSEDTDFQDFYNMVWFGYQDWYLKALKKEGFEKEKSSWNDFVKNNLGDLKKWIEENKPKK